MRRTLQTIFILVLMVSYGAATWEDTTIDFEESPIEAQTNIFMFIDQALSDSEMQVSEQTAIFTLISCNREQGLDTVAECIEQDNNLESTLSDFTSEEEFSAENTNSDNSNSVSRGVDYSSVEVDWELLNEEQIAAIAGVPKGMANKGLITNVESPTTAANLVRNVREEAINSLNWQHGAAGCADYNPERCSSSGNTFYVSSSEGWVLDPGTPAPHCYSGGYVPPAYGSLSDQVGEDVPAVSISFADTDNNQECPEWLDEDDIPTELENRFEWSINQEPSNPQATQTYPISYEVSGSESRLNSASLTISKKFEDNEDWQQVNSRTCGTNSDVCEITGNIQFMNMGSYRVKLEIETQDGHSATKIYDYEVEGINSGDGYQNIDTNTESREDRFRWTVVEAPDDESIYAYQTRKVNYKLTDSEERVSGVEAQLYRNFEGEGWQNIYSKTCDEEGSPGRCYVPTNVDFAEPGTYELRAQIVTEDGLEVDRTYEYEVYEGHSSNYSP